MNAPLGPQKLLPSDILTSPLMKYREIVFLSRLANPIRDGSKRSTRRL